MCILLSSGEAGQVTMDIIGLVVRTFPDRQDSISYTLRAIPGLEIHHFTSDGQMIVTIEQSTHEALKSALDQLERVDHVLSTFVVYQYSDEVDEDGTETSRDDDAREPLHQGP